MQQLVEEIKENETDRRYLCSLSCGENQFLNISKEFPPKLDAMSINSCKVFPQERKVQLVSIGYTRSVIISTKEYLQGMDLVDGMYFNKIYHKEVNVLISLTNGTVLSVNIKSIRLWSSDALLIAEVAVTFPVQNAAEVKNKIVTCHATEPGQSIGYITVWSIALELEHSISAHSGPVNDLVPLVTNFMASGSGDQTIKFWNTEYEQNAEIRTHQAVMHMTCLPRRRIVYRGEYLIEVIDESSNHLCAFASQEMLTTNLVILNDSSFAVGNILGEIKIYSIFLQKKLNQLKHSEGSVTRLVVHFGSLISLGED